ncbi:MULTISPECIES: ABC transporter substrate-binding protein [Halorussus]|uniref:ABC transporter substrate-binding protein n=1 Tax=Halorussus TaxID=1070314 RepID=UPI000E2181B1|nr:MULTISPECIES: ABC transporter substrate-binding protein [Halorussus]NHN58385.1 ABC transporter substrate-binding protein [Halorussus sp. JP-T4]
MGETRRQFLRATGVSAVGLAGAVGGAAGQSDGVSLLLNWKPNGLHIPYYAARARGYYEEQGVNLTRIKSGQGSDFAAKQVGLGNAPLAVTGASQVLNINTRGLNPQSVGVVMQRSPVVVFTTSDAFGGPMDRVDQLAGKTVGTGPGMVRILTKLLLERKGVLSEVELVDTGFDTVQQLLSGKIDAAGGVFADAVTARRQAGEVYSIPVAETIPSYGHVVAANSQFAADNPETVRGFLNATARGAAWATDNPERATDHLVEANPAISETADVQRAKWVEMAGDYVLSDAVRRRGWGWSDAQPWQTMYEALRDAELLGGETDPTSVWTNDYLDTEYEYVGQYASQVTPPESTATGTMAGGAGATGTTAAGASGTTTGTATGSDAGTTAAGGTSEPTTVETTAANGSN